MSCFYVDQFSPAPGLTRDELIKGLDGHVKQATGLIGTFSKP